MSQEIDSNVGGEIVLNETYFTDNKKSADQISNFIKLSQNDHTDQITITDHNLYSANFSQNEKKFTLPLLTNEKSTMYRDGFVTNKRYQNLKDSQHSASVLTNCYDEVFQPMDADEEIDDEDDDVKSQSSKSSSASSGEPSGQVVINMYNDDDEYETNKQKFEKSLTRKVRSIPNWFIILNSWN